MQKAKKGKRGFKMEEVQGEGERVVVEAPRRGGKKKAFSITKTIQKENQTKNTKSYCGIVKKTNKNRRKKRASQWRRGFLCHKKRESYVEIRHAFYSGRRKKKIVMKYNIHTFQIQIHHLQIHQFTFLI